MSNVQTSVLKMEMERRESNMEDGNHGFLLRVEITVGFNELPPH